VRRAKRAGRQVVFAAEDATRSDPRTLQRFVLAAAEGGADTVGLADTVGIADPRSMAELVGSVLDGCDLPVAVHCHDDMGLATANTLAGILAGASGAQCSVLGIGERAGNASLEQVAVALQVLHGRDAGLDLRALPAVAELVARAAGIRIPEQQPVVGAHAFTHESGLHLDGIRSDPATYEPCPPSVVGRARRVVLGKHSGASSIRHAADAAGIELGDAELRALLGELKHDASRRALGCTRDAETVLRDYLVARRG
jgi:isopropylmalate/homocitrate/citramalate synthase